MGIPVSAATAATLKLVDSELASQSAQALAAAADTGSLAKIVPAAEEALDALQRELDVVKAELSSLRQRDESHRFLMRRMDEELRLAARLQQDFLPKSLPKVGPVRFHTLFRPASHVSGDLYDVMRLDETHVGFYMADAVGHGMPAALLSMFLKTALKTKEINSTGYRLLEPGRAMARLNEALLEQELSQATFATAVYGKIDVNSLTVTFARGGHPNPIILTKDGDIRCVDSDGCLLGIFAEETFTEATIQLSPGDRLFVYSDGIEIALSDPLGVDNQRWREELYSRRHLTTPEIVAQLGQQIDRGGLDELKDDVTLIALEIQA